MRKLIESQIDKLITPTGNTSKPESKLLKVTTELSNTRLLTLTSMPVLKVERVNSTGPTNNKLLTDGLNQSNTKKEPLKDGKPRLVEQLKRSKLSSKLLNIKLKEPGQRDSKPLRIHGTSLLPTSINHNPLFPQMLSDLILEVPLRLELLSIKLSLMMFLDSTTTLLIKEENSNLRFKHTSSKRKPSTNNTPMPGTMKFRTSASLRKMEKSITLLTTRTSSSINGPTPLPLMLKLDKNSKLISLDTKDLSPLRKPLSKLLLKHNGQRDSQLTKLLLSNSTKTLTDHKKELLP